MYSFAQRRDVRVVDEPLYGHYLRVSGSPHPGRDDVIAAMDCNGDRVMAGLLALAEENSTRRLFIKHMAHHLIELDLGFLDATENIFLVRDPREMLPSLTIQVPAAELADTGLKRQWQLYESLVEVGQRPAILDSRELLLNPKRVLHALCEHLGLAFTEDMLEWPAGPIEQDGVWAPHWYHAVHESTGFAPYVAKTEFPDWLQPLLDECQPWYDNLYSVAIKAT